MNLESSRKKSQLRTFFGSFGRSQAVSRSTQKKIKAHKSQTREFLTLNTLMAIYLWFFVGAKKLCILDLGIFRHQKAPKNQEKGAQNSNVVRKKNPKTNMTGSKIHHVNDMTGWKIPWTWGFSSQSWSWTQGCRPISPSLEVSLTNSADDPCWDDLLSDTFQRGPVGVLQIVAPGMFHQFDFSYLLGYI